ncbi:hypothetical protein [Alkaliphilus hydrothermalis]|uniref:Bacteriocin-type signal sequence-containing protein n=1 Tax=Alkaliphilus hydrothermalis TaxID=1482730 RepID=A0ABS2NR47_9FIRM|nr:hypothetical protein [Alkaliphilus hydrothermalis]MBM7615039.1 hypothetical protein [Alkaliphilus hydrothermalis]
MNNSLIELNNDELYLITGGSADWFSGASVMGVGIGAVVLATTTLTAPVSIPVAIVAFGVFNVGVATTTLGLAKMFGAKV